MEQKMKTRIACRFFQDLFELTSFYYAHYTTRKRVDIVFEIPSDDAYGYAITIICHSSFTYLDKPWNISFKSGEQNNIVSVGETVKIICSATAFPAPDYIIFYNGMKLVDVLDGVKDIQSANLSDDGHYKCVANNSVGHVSASFNLIVNGRSTSNPCTNFNENPSNTF